MATTVRPQPSKTDPQVKRAVYAKYRQMLGSYHNQANDIIKQLPSYMVREDRGFHNNVIENNNAPPPPPPMSGNVPARRLQTQIPEAPACVQNAMMTKDKKPFTYTPGGIDLSQIKSPRMAKRVAMNANSEGVSSKPKVSPLAQTSNNNNNNNNSNNNNMVSNGSSPQNSGLPPPPPPPPAPHMGAAAMGMPFQVFPTGPPQTNGNNVAKKPQSFAPPPMGFRPEIKIPENPMAGLRSAPRPQPKGDYWADEYVQEKARDSISNEDDARQQFSQVASPVRQQPPPTPPVQQTVQKQSSPVQYAQRSPSPAEQREINIPVRNIILQEVRSASPLGYQGNRTPPVLNSQSSVSANIPTLFTPTKTVTVIREEPQAQMYRQPQSPQVQHMYQQQAPSPPQQQQPGGTRIIMSTMPNKQHQQPQKTLGSLYIPPPMSADDANKQNLLNQQSPPWMSSSSKQMDTPEWVNNDEVDNFNHQQRTAQDFVIQTPQSAGPRERVITIAMEKSPSKTPATPNFGPQPFYGNNNQQFSNVQPSQIVLPKIDPNVNQFVNQGYNNINYPQNAQSPRVFSPPIQQSGAARIIPIQVEGARSPMYNDQPFVMQSDPRTPQSPRVNSGLGTPNQSRSFRVLQQITDTFGGDDDSNSADEKVETEEDPMEIQQPLFSRPLGPNDMNENQLRRLQMSDNDKALMGRVKTQVDSEVYLHSEQDPRYRGGAIPSKAFKMLQKMTGGPQSSNQVTGRPNPNIAQQKSNFAQDDNQMPASEQQVSEPNLYQGSAIPSRSFKILQAMTQPENAADSNDSSDIEGTPNLVTGNPLDNSFNYSNKITNDHNSPYHLPHTVPIPPPPFPPHYYYDWQMYDPQTNPYWGYYYNQYQGFDPNFFGPPPQMPPHYQQQMPPIQSNGQPMPPPMPGNYFYGYPPPPPMPPYCYYNYHRNQMSSRETTPCFSENERSLKTPTNEDRNRRAVSCTPTCCNHAKSFVVDEARRQSFTLEEPNMKFQSPIHNQKITKIIKPVQYLTSDESSDNEENFNRLDYDSSLRRSLKSVPSVTNINLYNEDNSDLHLEELQVKPIIEEEDDDKTEEDDDEEEEDTTEVFEDISEDTETADLHFPHQLSIIYEENDESANRSRRSSIVSRCSTLSDCSTTLMEEDNISIDGSGDELNDDEEENSVTVRLPLKFSFTRSKDNLVNTTLIVGESEHSDNSSSSISIKATPVIKSLTPAPPTPTPISNNNSASDVSVTFRLPSKSKSRTPERGLLAQMRTLSNTNSMDSDSDLSVSISLPRKLNKSSKSPSWSELETKEDTAPNSNENKKHIDNHLNESIDAFEEIKREMEEITYSLCSRICSMRKSTINVPTHENRSSSTSQIDEIDTDSETDISFSLNDCRESFESQQDILGINEEMPDEEVVNYGIKDVCDTMEIKINAADGMDFWSEISSANKKFTELDSQPISKTSTRSSQKFWFEDEEDAVDEKPALLEEVVCKLEKNESIDNENENDTDFWASNTKFETGLRESISFQKGTENQNDEKDLKDEIEEDIVLPAEEYDESSEYESDPEDEEDIQTPEPKIKNEIITRDPVVLKKEDLSPPKPQQVVKKQESSETEWSEEEVDETEDEEPETEPPKKVELPKPLVVVMKTVIEKSKPLPPTPVESETEYEETEYEETEDEEEKPAPQEVVIPKTIVKTVAKMIVLEEQKPTIVKEIIKPVEVEETEEEEVEEEEESEIESEESEDEKPIKERSSSMISKGKSLVDVNAYIKYEGKKAPVIINNLELDDESEYSSAEEQEENIIEISNHQSIHSNDEYDDCQTLTKTQSTDVFLPSLTAISSFDSKSNMKSESGISCLTESHNGQESEDGYEEDSDDEVLQKDEEIIKVIETVETRTENEIKINVKNKISMFECPKIEEDIVVSIKEREVPRVSAKYSFKYRESSEPPAQLSLKCLEVPKVVPRAVSEAKEVVKNQRLIDMINQRKSLPPVPVNKREPEERKSVKERISTFESTESDASERRETFKRYGNSKKSIPAVRSIDSAEEDSGVTSDFCRQFSENETDSENFPELRKMSRYQRASTHSRLFKLLQDDEEVEGDEGNSEITEPLPEPEKPKKIIHNVSVTRRNNAAQNAETMEDRRKRLCLPLQGSSSGAESMSSSTTPSPTPGHVNEKLVNELVQSLLLQKKGKLFRNLPVEKLHAAAVKILQEDMESTGTLSSADESTIPTVDSTPALTPQEFRNNSSYSEYYDSWANADELSVEQPVIQSKAFKNLQDQQNSNNKKVWSVRCPRILSSKSVNKDLARLSEVRESESPEPSYSNSRSPSIRSLSIEPMSGESNSIRERLSARKCNT